MTFGEPVTAGQLPLAGSVPGLLHPASRKLAGYCEPTVGAGVSGAPCLGRLAPRRPVTAELLETVCAESSLLVCASDASEREEERRKVNRSGLRLPDDGAGRVGEERPAVARSVMPGLAKRWERARDGLD